MVMIMKYLHYMMMQVKVTAMTLPAIALFCMSALISAFLFHDHHRRKVFVGTVGLVASSAMYGSPLVAVVGPSHFTL